MQRRREFFVGAMGLGGIWLLPARAGAMTSVTVHNQASVVIATAMVSGRLQLSVGGTVLGPLINIFDPSPPPPATMRLTVSNLPGGGAVTAQWQPWSGGTWTSFVTTTGGCYYDFPLPGLGLTTAHRVEAHNPSGAASSTQYVLHASSEAG